MVIVILSVLVLLNGNSVFDYNPFSLIVIKLLPVIVMLAVIVIVFLTVIIFMMLISIHLNY